MVSFPALILHCASNNPAVLDLFISSDASICSTIAFPALGNSDHVVVSVAIDFSSNSKRDVQLHHITYDCSCADWDGLHDHLRDVLWKDIFKFSASAAASEFYEWVQVINDYRLVLVEKGFLKLQIFHILIKQTSPSLIRNWLWGLWQIANSVLNKCKSAILPLFNCPEVLSSSSDKVKLFATNYSKNSNLEDLRISLPTFSSTTNLRLQISVTSKMGKKVIMNLD